MPNIGTQPSYFGMDILKHVLAICVIIQHMHSSTRYSEATNGNIAQVVVLVQGAVLVFFLIAGYFFHVKREADVVGTMSKHVQWYGKRLLTPFVLFSVINAAALLALGKLRVYQGMKDIAIGHGVGMQMYFLPFLFLVTTVAALIQSIAAFSRRREVVILMLLAVALVALALHCPTQNATGDSYYLLPLYLLSFMTGRLIALVEELASDKIALILGGMVLSCCVIGRWDIRFYYVAAGIVAFAAARYLSVILPSRRAPGSGGVYLMHTPIINFAVSSALVKIGIVQWPNAILGVVCTYILCLAFTMWFIKTLPNFRRMLLE